MGFTDRHLVSARAFTNSSFQLNGETTDGEESVVACDDAGDTQRPIIVLNTPAPEGGEQTPAAFAVLTVEIEGGGNVDC